MPASPYSSNVILAKARAMYGRCLTAQDFHNLLACHSVSEIASYLKNRTAYAGVLADINESTIHRGHLESLLRRKLWNDYASLSRYDRTVGMRMSDYLIQLAEIQQILACLRLMSAGRTQEFFFAMPMFLNGHTHLDLARMAHSKITPSFSTPWGIRRTARSWNAFRRKRGASPSRPSKTRCTPG